jgi:hypothetical protein
MKLKVTEEGLLIPKELLDLGRFHLGSGVSDASEKHETYLSKRDV